MHCSVCSTIAHKVKSDEYILHKLHTGHVAAIDSIHEIMEITQCQVLSLESKYFPRNKVRLYTF